MSAFSGKADIERYHQRARALRRWREPRDHRGARDPPSAGDNALLVDCLDLFLVGGEASRTAGFEPEARALDIGFQNPSHFARMFRKFVGTSPSHFQNQK